MPAATFSVIVLTSLKHFELEKRRRARKHSTAGLLRREGLSISTVRKDAGHLSIETKTTCLVRCLCSPRVGK